MDKGWIKIIQVTGSVGVMALLLSTLMMHLFQTEIVNLLGSDNLFYLIVFLISVIAIGIILAILKFKHPDKTQLESKEPKKDIKVKYDNGSTHNGDNNF